MIDRARGDLQFTQHGVVYWRPAVAFVKMQAMGHYTPRDDRTKAGVLPPRDDIAVIARPPASSPCFLRWTSISFTGMLPRRDWRRLSPPAELLPGVSDGNAPDVDGFRADPSFSVAHITLKMTRCLGPSQRSRWDNERGRAPPRLYPA